MTCSECQQPKPVSTLKNIKSNKQQSTALDLLLGYDSSNPNPTTQVCKDCMFVCFHCDLGVPASQLNEDELKIGVYFQKKQRSTGAVLCNDQECQSHKDERAIYLSNVPHSTLLTRIESKREKQNKNSIAKVVVNDEIDISSAQNAQHDQGVESTIVSSSPLPLNMNNEPLISLPPTNIAEHSDPSSSQDSPTIITQAGESLIQLHNDNGNQEPQQSIDTISVEPSAVCTNINSLPFPGRDVDNNSTDECLSINTQQTTTVESISEPIIQPIAVSDELSIVRDSISTQPLIDEQPSEISPTLNEVPILPEPNTELISNSHLANASIHNFIDIEFKQNDGVQSVLESNIISDIIHSPNKRKLLDDLAEHYEKEKKQRLDLELELEMTAKKNVELQLKLHQIEFNCASSSHPQDQSIIE